MLQPLYGFGGSDPVRFLRTAGFPDVFYAEDPELTVDQVGVVHAISIVHLPSELWVHVHQFIVTVSPLVRGQVSVWGLPGIS